MDAQGGPGDEVRNTVQCRPVRHFMPQHTFEFKCEHSSHSAHGVLSADFFRHSEFYQDGPSDLGQAVESSAKGARAEKQT